MDNILVLDVSGSMAGSALRELKEAVLQFILLIEKLGLGDRVALITFGGSARTVCSLTDNYSVLKQHIRNLSANGGTPMAEGLVCALEQFKNCRIGKIGRFTILPRIILMTDGAPDNKQQVLAVANILGEHNLPVSCVGVTGCDRQLMATISQISGGMFVMADDVTLLQLFFIRQVLLIVYLTKMQETLENLLNRELLRAFLEHETGQAVSDSELDGFIFLMQHLIRDNDPSPSSYSSTDDYDGPRVIELDVEDHNQSFMKSNPPPTPNYFRNPWKICFSFTLLLCQCALLGVSIWGCILIYPDIDQDTNLLALIAVAISLGFGCFCSCHLIYRSFVSKWLLWTCSLLPFFLLGLTQVLTFLLIHGEIPDPDKEILYWTSIGLLGISGFIQFSILAFGVLRLLNCCKPANESYDRYDYDRIYA